jgi:hypothetical protein
MNWMNSCRAIAAVSDSPGSVTPGYVYCYVLRSLRTGRRYIGSGGPA